MKRQKVVASEKIEKMTQKRLKCADDDDCTLFYSRKLQVQENKFARWLCILTTTSVTRFGEISPLRQKLTSLWQFFDILFLIWQNAGPSLVNLLH